MERTAHGDKFARPHSADNLYRFALRMDLRFADLIYQGYSIPFKLEYHFAFLRGLAKHELK